MQISYLVYQDHSNGDYFIYSRALTQDIPEITGFSFIAEYSNLQSAQAKMKALHNQRQQLHAKLKLLSDEIDAKYSTSSNRGVKL